MLLTIETIDRGGSVALAREDGIIELTFRRTARPHSRRLFSDLEEMLASRELDYSDLDSIAVLVGPGAFTAIRLGVTAAKVLASVCEARLVGVTSLKLLAQFGVGQKKLVRTAIGARRGELYYRDYYWEESDQRFTAASEARLLTPGELKAECQQGEESLLIHRGRQWKPAEAEWPESVTFYPVEQSRVLSSPLVEVARRRLQEDCTDDPDRLSPFYLRGTDATVPGDDSG